MRLNFLTRSTPQLVGIDIGSHEVKAILLAKTEDGYKIISYAAEPVKAGAVNERDIRDEDAVIESLKRIKQALPASAKYAAVAVSGSAVMTKVIYMDASLSEDEMAAHIEVEADHLIPYSLDEVSIDFETLNVNHTDPSKVDVLLSACHADNINIRVHALDSVELGAKVVDVEGYALGRSVALVIDQLPDGAQYKTIAMVDIGATMMTIAVVESGATTFIREQAIGGELFTQSIASFYGMSHQEAEKAKLEQNLPLNYAFDVLSPFQTQLLQQIKRTLQLYCTSSGKDKVDYLILCGGTSTLEGLAELLTNELGVYTLVADPFQGCLHAERTVKDSLKHNISQYMIACGLALRSYGKWRT